jgi:hypothetical protein
MKNKKEKITKKEEIKLKDKIQTSIAKSGKYACETP